MEIYDDFLSGVGYSEMNESSGLTKEEFRRHNMFTIFGKYFRYNVINFSSNNEYSLLILFYNIFYRIFNILLLYFLDLTPNCDNTRDVHPEMRGNVNLEVSFKEATKKTITVIMYTASSGGISVTKDFDVQLLSSDY